ncbi:MAG: hypothetical protein A3B53_03030 [Candidatus Levybacteria bacterium RIFCSPLOWO2_01_FULL_42_15]|nr:MAG: hypothetical protein A3B53_03030 [Candidatus Levybacteria bacterium RIFCSPLOWO2_01_FULL_42_15]
MGAISSIIEDLADKAQDSEFGQYDPSANSIQNPAMPEGGRSLAEYEAIFNFDREELRDKIVLDLGAGPKVKLANELKDICARVVSISPDFSNPVHAIRAKISTEDLKVRDNMVAAIGVRIPFPDQTFHAVFAMHCHIPFGPPTFVVTLAEMARILKKGGIGIIGPYYEIPHHPNLIKKLAKANPELMAILQHYRVQLRAEAISPNIVPMAIVSDGEGDKAWEPSFNVVLRKSV